MRRNRLVADCGGVAQPTLGTIEGLCRLKLEARRSGCDLELRNAAPSLLELLDLVGLAALLLAEGERQTEQREEPRGVKEEGELGDLSI